MRKTLSLFILLCLFSLAAMAGGITTNYRTALVMAYSPANSVFEDDNIKLEIYDEKLWATNKTNKTIFIDLSQCFMVHNGSSFPMFNSEKQNEKIASKANRSTSIDEFITVAPVTGAKQNETFICNMSLSVYRKYNTTESTGADFSDYDKRLLTLLNDLLNESLRADSKGKEYLGTASRHLTEDESISNIGANIAYAFSKRSENWTPVAISTWVSDVYFAPYYVEMPTDLKKKQMRGFGIKETEAATVHIKADSPFEFDEDKSPIIVCDWTGDYKKGTFELKSTWVQKTKMGLGKALLAGLTSMATGVNTVSLFAKINVYKQIIHFDGANDNWGKMTYFKNDNFSKFDNKR